MINGYDCSYKGFKSCDDNSVCSSDGGKTVCAKSTIARMCTTDKATHCGDALSTTLGYSFSGSSSVSCTMQMAESKCKAASE